MDGTVIKMDEEDSIQAFIPGKKFVFKDIPYYYKTVNIYKFSKHFSEHYYVPFLEAYSKALGNNEYYEQVLRVITMLDHPEIKAKKLSGQLWYEIDDIQDLDIASSIFTTEEQRVRLLEQRQGGYWRYPKLLDFSHPGNPHYPPQRLLNEMKSNMDTLLVQYPSGPEVNSLLATKNFGIQYGHILAVNYAAAFVKCLSYQKNNRIGMMPHQLEECTIDFDPENYVPLTPKTYNFRYSSEEIIQFMKQRSLDRFLLVNPDPLGGYMQKAEVIHLLEWCRLNGSRIIVDESYADFGEDKEASLINEEVIQENPNLVIIKSLSVSYGIPGISLGIIASADEELIRRLKKDNSISNLNSFSEFYLQIAEKYESEQKTSL